MQEHQPVPDPGASPTTAGSTDPFDDARSMQILSTEHWSLLATRSLSWNEFVQPCRPVPVDRLRHGGRAGAGRPGDVVR